MTQFSKIGQQLRTHRMETGLRTEEIAARLGVSRAAYYRYEKGEVIKLDTVTRVAELMNIPVLKLLGIGMEYYSSPIEYLKRILQIEDSTDQIIQLCGPIFYPTTSNEYDSTLEQVILEWMDTSGIDQGVAQTDSGQVLNALSLRKLTFAERRPSVIAILTPSAIEKFIEEGIGGNIPLSARLKKQSLDVARYEIELMVNLMESEPIGLQFGLSSGEVNGPFVLMRTSNERSILAINPFPSDATPNSQRGVAMITSMEDAVMSHQQIAEARWRGSTKGVAAAKQIKALLAAKKT